MATMPFFSQQSSGMIADERSVHDSGLLDHAVSSGDFKENHLLTSHFRLSSAYRFPLLQCDKQKHSIQHSWLSRSNSLVYSELDKGECFRPV